jgi:hypothetical protein
VNRTTKVYLCAVVLATCTLLDAIDESSSATNAVNMLRRINTEEQDKRRTGPFVQIPQLPDVLRGALRAYDVHLTVSGDGKQYAVLLTDRNASAITFYSDERGLIYRAEPIQ